MFMLIIKKVIKSVTGKIKNNSNTDSYSGFVVEFSIYNEDNSIIQTMHIVIDDTIPPGEVFEFDNGILHVDAFQRKLLI